MGTTARRRCAVACAAALAALGAAAPVALAHGERDPAVRAVVDAAPAGLTARVAPGVAQRLELVNSTREPVEVLGEGGQPFLRIGPGGVEANVAAPAWYASGNPDAVFRPGPGIGRGSGRGGARSPPARAGRGSPTSSTRRPACRPRRSSRPAGARG